MIDHEDHIPLACIAIALEVVRCNIQLYKDTEDHIN